MKARVPLNNQIGFKLMCLKGKMDLKKYFFTTDYVPKMDEPYIFISNHTTDYDAYMAFISAKEFLYLVAEESPFRIPVVGSVLKFLLSPVTVKLGNITSSDIKEIIKKIKSGYNVALYPEGRHSYDGVTMKQDDSIGKLVRLSGAALVTYKIEGGYFLKPRWSRFKRTGPVSGHVTSVYSSEELKNKTPEEITEIINKGIYEDAYLTQEKYKYKYKGTNRAEGMEKLLFICPKCHGIDTMKSKGDTCSCSSCPYTVTWNDTGFLEGEDLKYDNVRDWYSFVKDEYTKNVVKTTNKKLIESYNVILSVDKKETSGELKAYKEYFLFNDFKFPLNELSSVRVQYADILNFNYKGKHYRFTGDKFYPWKYAKIYNIYKGRNQEI